MTEGLALSVCLGCCGASPSADRQLCLLITAENIRSPWGGQEGSWLGGQGGYREKGWGCTERLRERKNQIGKDIGRVGRAIAVVVWEWGSTLHSCLSLYHFCLEKPPSAAVCLFVNVYKGHYQRKKKNNERADSYRRSTFFFFKRGK